MQHPPFHPSLIDLATANTPSAVEAFAFGAGSELETEMDAASRTYKALIPQNHPAPGEQYAFEVELDRCSACKACVSACHHMNGLSEDESWRRVRQWITESEEASWIKTVTTACHHCIEPACMHGCPVGAYEKHPITGIVKHLDDQCIGCEYCIWQCPYEVPRYHEEHGIVRKCDMCSERLSQSLEPACVQACPHDAIRIGLAKTDDLINDRTGHRSRKDVLYPGAPSSSISVPSTRYTSRKDRRKKDWIAMDPPTMQANPHWPLVIMLILTQMGVGGLIFQSLSGYALETRVGGTWEFWLSAGCVMAGLSASVFHLGHPLKAWRFFIGLRRSWLSREILAFNLLAGMIVATGIHSFYPILPTAFPTDRLLMFLGVSAVMTSVMIYHDTGRPCWQFWRTSGRFAGSVLLGAFMVCTLRISLDADRLQSVHSLVVWLSLYLALVGKHLSMPTAQSDRGNATKSKAVNQPWIEKLTEPAYRSRWTGLSMLAVCGLPAGDLAQAPEAWGGICSLLAIASLLVLEFAERVDFFRSTRAPEEPLTQVQFSR